MAKKPIPSAEESFESAVSKAISEKNNSEFVFWSDLKNLKKTSFQSTVNHDGSYVAHAEGTVSVGKTRVKDDRFFMPKNHSFKIRYKSAKDAIGAPSVVIEQFDLEALQTDPSLNHGKPDAENDQPKPLTGELVPKPTGGSVTKKIVSKR